MPEKQLELRAYFFVPYNISPIQHGIQAGHSLGELLLKYGRYDPNHIIWDYLEKYKTWIILNGGTTNTHRNFEGIADGDLDQIGDLLRKNDIEFSYFFEPDLNHALTAVCFVADERIWNYEDYPDFLNWILNIKMYQEAKDGMSAQGIVMLRMKTMEELIVMFPDYHKEWVAFLGGEKNVFLRELIRGKKLA